MKLGWFGDDRWLVSIFTAGSLFWGVDVPGAGVEAVFYAAPDGKDTQNGTRETPFASLQRARDAARQRPATERKIILRGGNYYNVSVVLDGRDSGLTITAETGETPVLYGGQPITGWEKEGEHWVAAKLPEYPQDPEVRSMTSPAGWEIRMLQVNGRYCPRARFPKMGRLTHETQFNVPWMSTTGGGWKRKPTHEELTLMKYKAGDLGEWLDTANAEVTVYHMWDESCVGIAHHDPTNRVLTLSPELGHPPGAFGVRQYVLWNTREGMTEPGQWYQDRQRNKLVYWPKPGEEPRNLRVIAPTRETILRFQGNASRKVSGVTLDGLHFAVTTVPLKAAGFAAAAFAGAIQIDQTEDCLLENLEISRVGGHAISTRGRGNQRLRIEHCLVENCGAGGIYAGGENARISNNHVRAIGLAYPSAIGIFRGGNNCVVSHNEVHDCSYSAINYGGNNNRVEYNLLYACMRELHDGAGIYMFAGTNCVLRGNVARDISDTGGYGASAYYLDERCWNCVVESNLSVRVGWPSHNHMATNNVIRDNVFVVEGNAKLTFPRSTSFRLERNVVFATGKIRIENIDGVDSWKENLFYSGTGKVELVKMTSYSTQGSSEGLPGDTLLADPLFEDWQKGDFRYRPNSPALKLGLRSIAWQEAGPKTK